MFTYLLLWTSFPKKNSMRKIIDKILYFFKLKIKKESPKIEEVIEPQIKRLTYTKRTDI
jgi:hypothetical protein